MEGQILIFRTSIRNARDIKHIAALFTLCPQIYKWNVDMEDWEKVLRIECQDITPTEISKALRAINIYAQAPYPFLRQRHDNVWYAQSRTDGCPHPD